MERRVPTLFDTPRRRLDNMPTHRSDPTGPHCAHRSRHMTDQLDQYATASRQASRHAHRSVTLSKCHSHDVVREGNGSFPTASPATAPGLGKARLFRAQEAFRW